MIEIRRILCPIDFSDHSRHALDCAFALARWYGSHVIVLHAYTRWPPEDAIPPSRLEGALYAPSPDVQIDREGMRRQMQLFVQGSGADTICDVVLQETGDVHREILAQAAATAADLIVIGSHGRSGFERLLLGSVTEKILRKATCPVMVVPPRAGELDPATPVRFKRILCAVDFSTGSSAALGYALSLAEEADATLTLLHVIEIPPELYPTADARHVNVDKMRAAAEAEQLRALRALVPEGVEDYCTVETAVAEGRASREIVRLASARQIELIVMGVQGRGAVDLLLFGSNSHEVIRAAPCPVLTIRARSSAA
jgi:nucleotide-binding universal stress UspA family protein